MRAAAALVLLLAGCGSGVDRRASAAGDRLEAVATAAGLVASLVPGGREPVSGVWASDGDRLCIAPPAAGVQRVGVAVDRGPGNACVAQGTLGRDGDVLAMDLGRCRLKARLDGDRIVFPPDVDEACALSCRGEATLAGLRAERIGASSAEIAAFRTRSGRLLCVD